MGLPPKDNIHLPLLKVVSEAGGSMDSHEVTVQVRKLYPEMSPEDLASTVDSGENRLNNRIQWAKQDLVLTGDLERSTSGLWKITLKGRDTLAREWTNWKPVYYKTPLPRSIPSEIQGAEKQTVTSNEKLVSDPTEELERARREIVLRVEREVLERLHGVDPGNFETIIAKLLEVLEYGTIVDGTIKVTGRTGDGGIDGECAMDRLGLYKTKFQAERWKNLVSSKEVRNFIGALTTERVEQGIFVTTSTFTPM